jgi:hypothetical protein
MFSTPANRNANKTAQNIPPKMDISTNALFLVAFVGSVVVVFVS